ncbi:MAG: hypothetical protein LW822_10300 [Phycisphaeraceae bacterium]|jgi:hypothetical protein|nr:hypothetical protein [Phycisphaeraceae bacterium]
MQTHLNNEQIRELTRTWKADIRFFHTDNGTMCHITDAAGNLLGEAKGESQEIALQEAIALILSKKGESAPSKNPNAPVTAKQYEDLKKFAEDLQDEVKNLTAQIAIIRAAVTGDGGDDEEDATEDAPQ